MKAILKTISSYEGDLKNYQPEDNYCFCLELLLTIGLPEKEGADFFSLFVCTPKWLQNKLWEPKWGRHMLIVREYDLDIIKKNIDAYINKCDGKDWAEIANKLARNFQWEFEDYSDLSK